MYVYRVQYKWMQTPGACYDRPVRLFYNLFQFVGPAEVEVDGKVIKTRANACIVYAPMQRRYFRFPDRVPMNFVHLLDAVQPLVEQYEIPLGQVFYPDDPGEIAELYRKIMREFNAAEPYREELLDCYVKELFAKISRSVHKKKFPTADMEKLQQLHWQILSQPEYGWTVEEMAKSVSLSVSRLHALYRMCYGIAPMQEVIRCRIEQAKSMLLDSNMPLNMIAERLGYSNQYHFIRQFKAQTGMPPGAYRKKNT